MGWVGQERLQGGETHTHGGDCYCFKLTTILYSQQWIKNQQMTRHNSSYFLSQLLFFAFWGVKDPFEKSMKDSLSINVHKTLAQKVECEFRVHRPLKSIHEPQSNESLT